MRKIVADVVQSIVYRTVVQGSNVFTPIIEQIFGLRSRDNSRILSRSGDHIQTRE